MHKRSQIAAGIIVGIVAALLLVCGGLLLGLNPGVQDALRESLPSGWVSDTEECALQQEVIQELQSNYYKEIDETALKTAAIDGMVASLDDPYTVYMDPQEYAAFLEQTSGSYSGVGMTVEMKDNLVTIVSTFKSSPADLAGIRPGDIILEVDGVPTDGLGLDEVVGRIKGPEGSKVTLKIYRPSPSTPASSSTSVPVSTPAVTTTTTLPTTTSEAEQETADTSHLPVGGTTNIYTLVRKTIEIPVTESELLTVGDKKVAHLSLFTFSDGSAQALRADVRKAVEADKADAIILDLRSNGGGLLDEAVGVASIFVSEGPIVSTEGLHSPKQVFEATGGAYTKVPLYVLTDPYTASASEIVAGALQDYKRALLVGEKTFGKGLVQSVATLSNGGALKLTTAVYLTPAGCDINKKGISPDVVAPDDPNTPEVDECLQSALGLIEAGRVAQ